MPTSIESAPIRGAQGREFTSERACKSRPQAPDGALRASKGDRESEALRQRLRAALQGKTIREVAAETQTCPETVRRYLKCSVSSVEFLTKVCHVYGLSAEWLIFGRGAPSYIAAQFNVIVETELSLILTEIARRWDRAETLLSASHAGSGRAGARLGSEPPSREVPSLNCRK